MAEVGGASLSPELPGPAAHGAADDAISSRIPLSSAPSALGAHKGWHRLICDGCPLVLGVPLGTGAAHVIELGPVRIEQASRQAVRELGEIGQYARRHAVRGAASSRLFHDPLRSTLRLTGSPFRSVLIPWSAPLPPIIAPNVLKASTNSLVISVLWQSVAEKLRLGLRTDAIRSHFAYEGSQSGALRSGFGSDGGPRGLRRVAPQVHRITAGITTASEARRGSCLACHFGPGPRI